jgi:hypothetical protein
MVTRVSKKDIPIIRKVAEYLMGTEQPISRMTDAKMIPAIKLRGSWWLSNSVSDEWNAAHISARLAADADPELLVGRSQ